MTILRPKNIVQTKYGPNFDSDLVSYGVAPMWDPGNVNNNRTNLFGGVGTGFALMKKFFATGQIFDGTTQHANVLLLPRNVAHAKETAGTPTYPPLLIENVIIYAPDGIFGSGIGAGNAADIQFGVNLSNPGFTAGFGLCSMAIATVAPPIPRTFTYTGGGGNDIIWTGTAIAPLSAMNENWAGGFAPGIHANHNPTNQTHFISAPGGKAGDDLDRIVLAITASSAGNVGTWAAGELNVYVTGKVLPSY